MFVAMTAQNPGKVYKKVDFTIHPTHHLAWRRRTWR